MPPFLVALLRHLDLEFVGRSVGLASLVGLAGGLAAVVFELLIHFVRETLVAPNTGLVAEGVGGGVSVSWWIVLVPAVGGLAVGWMIARWAPEAEGHGTEAMVSTFHKKGGVVPRRVIGVKALASAITIGTGGSAGQEGPVAQIGSGVGSGLSDAFKLPERDRRTFLLAGASAGIGAMFCAPLGGALFAPEVLYRKSEFEGEAIIPCIIASIIAYTTRVTLTGAERAIELPQDIVGTLGFGGLTELPFYLALALVCVLFGWAYISIFNAVHAQFERITQVPRWVRPGIGGLLLGLLALAIAPLCGEQGVLFGGYRLMEAAMHGELAVGVLLLLAFAKILGTALSIGTGGSGGLFAPSLAIGALLGAAVGLGANALFGVQLEPAAFALVGMGGFFAGVAKTPVASIIIVCEMSGSYELLAPLMLVAVVHMMLASRWTIYESQVDSQVDSPAHAGDFVVDVLERMRVEEVVDRDKAPTLVSENATMRKALQTVATSVGTYFPVVDAEERLVGIFSLSDVRRIFHQTDVQDLVIVRDFMVDKVATVQASDNLDLALRRLNELAIHELPVVGARDPRRVVAMLSRNQIGAAYTRRLQELRRAPMVGS